jgi:hypothetical protein
METILDGFLTGFCLGVAITLGFLIWEVLE